MASFFSNDRRLVLVILGVGMAAACGGSTASVATDAGAPPATDSGAPPTSQKDGGANTPDGSRADDADAPPPPVADAAADAAPPSHDCTSAGGACASGSQCPGGFPALAASCANAHEVCCAPPPEAGPPDDPDASLGISCEGAGGSCNSTGSICAHGEIPTNSCGDPSMWMCCAP